MVCFLLYDNIIICKITWKSLYAMKHIIPAAFKGRKNSTIKKRENIRTRNQLLWHLFLLTAHSKRCVVARKITTQKYYYPPRAEDCTMYMYIYTQWIAADQYCSICGWMMRFIYWYTTKPPQHEHTANWDLQPSNHPHHTQLFFYVHEMKKKTQIFSIMISMKPS